MIITYSRSGSGIYYPYFICAGRHSKRKKDCKQKAVLVDVLERKVEQLYDCYSFPAGLRVYLENWLHDYIQTERQKYETELDGLRREKEKLERRRKKLLEAHYNDAIPLDLLKEEQQKITKQLLAIDHEIKAHNDVFATISERLGDAMELIEDCGKTYRLADDHVKRMMNQAIFSKIWVEPDGSVTAELAKPFDTLVKPVGGELARYNNEKIRGAEALTDFLLVISNKVQIFLIHCLNNDLLVETTGLEPVASCV